MSEHGDQDHDSIRRTIAKIVVGATGTLTLGGLIACAIVGASPGFAALTAANVASLVGNVLPNLLSDSTKHCVKKVMAFLFEKKAVITTAAIAHGIDDALNHDPSLSKAVLHDVRRLLADGQQLITLLEQLEANQHRLKDNNSELLTEVQNTHLSTVAAYEYLNQQIASLGESQNLDAIVTLDLLFGIKGQLTSVEDKVDRVYDRLIGVNQPFSAAARREVQAAFLDHVIENFAAVRFRGVQQVKLSATLPIESVYVNLTARATSAGMNSRFNDRNLAALTARTMPADPALAEELQWRTIRPADGPPLKLDRVVVEQENLILLGEPGAGKTTTLNYVSYCHALALRDGKSENEFGPTRLPIYVRIGSYAAQLGQADMSLGKYLTHFYSGYNFTDPRLADLFTASLNEGRAIVMLDGLDEISIPALRPYIMRQIETLAKAYPNNRFIVTSRVASYAAAAFGSDWKQFTIQPMQRDEVSQFIARWCREVEAQTAQHNMQEAEQIINGILRAIDSNPGVARLATNPLLLVVLAFTYRNVGQLPERRIQLYHLAAQTLAHDWRLAQMAAAQEGQRVGRSGQGELLPEEQLGAVLSQLAYCLRAYRSDGLISEPELRHFLRSVLPQVLDDLPDPDHPTYQSRLLAKADLFIERIKTDTGLLVERGYNQDDQPLFGFMHPTFEEYYAARHLVTHFAGDRLALVRLLCRHLPDSRWEEVLLLVVGYLYYVISDLKGAPEVLSHLCFSPNPLPPQEDLLHRGLLFGWRAAADGLKQPAGGANRLIQDTLNIYCDNDTVKGKGRYELLQEQLEGVIARTEADGNIVNERLTIALLEKLSKDSQLVYRYPRLFRVSQPLRQAAIATLLADWQQADNGNLRLMAATTMGKLAVADPEVVKALLASVQPQDGDWVRRTAIVSLGQIRVSSDEVINSLLTCLKDEHHTVRRAAAAALGRLGSTSDEVVNALLRCLEESTDHSVCSSVVAAFGQLGTTTERVNEALLVSLQQPEDDLERSSAATTLGQLKANNEQVVNRLLERLRLDEDSAVRSAIATTLGQIGVASGEVIAALLIILRDGEEDVVRSAAAAALGQLGIATNEVMTTLLGCLAQQAEDGSVRSWSANALGRLGATSSEALATLITSLRDRDDEVRLAAAEALVTLGDSREEVMQELRYAAQHPTSFLRYDRAYRTLYEAVSKQRSEPDAASCSWLDSTLIQNAG